MRPHLFKHEGLWCVRGCMSLVVYAWEEFEHACEFAKQVYAHDVAAIAAMAAGVEEENNEESRVVH